jgi:hypothetical protein
MHVALVQVGPDHAIAGIIHTQIMRDDTQTDPQSAFSANINAPGVPPKTLPLNNNSSIDIPVHSGAMQGTIHIEVDDFRVLPSGATAGNATAIACKIVFKLKEFFTVTIGSLDVTASLK